ncbi:MULTISPECIES: hypothetical protein [unclassified Pseudonocardia]|nr:MULTISPECIES: hypothetical protein [unclassified Pseudonocardia]
MEPTTLVVGGTTGLGQAVSIDRLRRGHRVIVVGRDRARLTDLVAKAE